MERAFKAVCINHLQIYQQSIAVTLEIECEVTYNYLIIKEY